MKKISLMFAALATTMAFTSCDESKDDHPTLKPNDGVIVENFLNTPEMSNMSVELTEENKANSLHMTCSQPSYGYAATVRYNVEVSFSPDFSEAAAPGLPVSAILETPFYDCSEVNPSYGDLAVAMNNLLGIKSDKEVPTGYFDIYARLIANIEVAGGADVYPNTTYQSNIVKLTRANCEYLAIILPGQPTGIFLRGGMNDWGAPAEWEFLTTEESGVSAIESCSISAGTEFKLADANWASINMGLGSQTFEIGVPYELNTDPANGGPGDMTMPANFTGRVQLTKKGSTYTVLFEAAEPDTPGQPTGVYLKGDMNGWGVSDEFLTTDVKNVWLIQGVTIAAGEGFKLADADWSKINLGATPDAAIEVGKAYTLTSGGENMSLSAAFTGDIKLQLQGGAYKMTLIAL